jgi:hypothetical protein
VLVRSSQRAVIDRNISYEDSDHLNWPDAESHPRLYQP